MISNGLHSSNYKNRFLDKDVKFYCTKAFFLGLIISFLIFIPFIVMDQGYFIYYGDFNVQEIPFYKLAHNAVKSGNIFWDFYTDLGANFIGSYSFYMLGSPFFLLTLPFPNHVVPYLMGPLLMLKFAFASVTSFVYLKRYVRNYDLAILGSILYAFSGFSIYNIFFNHFHEAIVIFPLLLYACDEFMYKKRRGLFAFCVFLSCTFNYYFFVNQVVFIIIYWCVKTLSKSWCISLKQFLYLMFESILGVMMSCFILIPSILAAIQNPRTNNFPQGFSALLYGYEQRYLHIITSLFFPPDIPARPNFTPGSEAKWASVAAWLPFFGMSGPIAFINSKQNSWLKRIIVILLFMAMVPVLNSAFQLFNMTFYTRWFYTLTLMTSLATIKSLDENKIKLRNGVLWSTIITVSIALCLGLIPDTNKIGLVKYPDRFLVYVSISILGLLTLLYVITNNKIQKHTSVKLCTFLTATFSIATSIYIISLGKSYSYSTKEFIIPHCLNNTEKISLEDVESSRVDVYDGMDNQAMFFNFKTIQAFHTIVPGSVMEFYPSIGVKRDVASRPDTKYYALRSLTSCKYLLSYNGNDKKFNSLVMPGWEFHSKQNEFNVWENNCFIPFGFTYNDFISTNDYYSIDESLRHLALLKAIVLNDDSIERNNDILNQAVPSSFSFSEDEYFADCQNRNNLTCTDFKIDRYGFSAEIDVPEGKDQLVFFSVPFEKGFSAKVNSKDAVIEKSNIGFMAVRVPSGQKSFIRFNYMTPGLIEGVIISTTSMIFFVFYFILTSRKKSRQKFQNRISYHIILKSHNSD